MKTIVNGVLRDAKDDRISKLASKFCSNIILSPVGKNCRKLAEYPISPNFDIFWPKRVQISFDLNFETRFEILSSLSIPYGPTYYYFHILIFWPPMLGIIFDHECRRGHFSGKCKFRLVQRDQRYNMHQIGEDRVFSKSCTNRITLRSSRPLPPLLTHEASNPMRQM